MPKKDTNIDADGQDNQALQTIWIGIKWGLEQAGTQIINL